MVTSNSEVSPAALSGWWRRPASRGRRPVVIVGLAGLLTLTAACGSTSSSDDSQDGSSSASVVAQAQQAVAKNRLGTDRAMPSTSPTPLPDQNIWIISCTQAAEGCSQPAAGAKEAGESLGWQMTVFDGQSNPDTIAAGIRSAIADQADGIILSAVDCVTAKSALQEAHDAGIKVYGIGALDCDDPFAGSGEPLFDASSTYDDGRSFAEYAEDVYARSIADYAIAETDGKAQIIAFTQEDNLAARHLVRGFEKRIEECSTCTIVDEVPITFSDLVSGKLQSKASAALTRNPQADVVFAPYDTALILGISQAVVASGRKDDLLVPGGEGLTPNIDFVRDDKGQTSIAGSPANWVGWAAIDGMNRVLNGEPNVDSGIGIQTLDREGPLPESTTYYDGNIDADGNPKQDYKAAYAKLWGKS